MIIKIIEIILILIDVIKIIVKKFLINKINLIDVISIKMNHVNIYKLSIKINFDK